MASRSDPHFLRIPKVPKDTVQSLEEIGGDEITFELGGEVFRMDIVIERNNGLIAENLDYPPVFPAFPCAFSTESYPLTISLNVKSTQDLLLVRCKTFLVRDDYSVVWDALRRKEPEMRLTFLHLQRNRRSFTTGRFGFACTFNTACNMRGQVCTASNRGLLHLVIRVEYGVDSYEIHLPDVWIFSKIPPRKVMFEMTSEVLSKMDIVTLKDISVGLSESHYKRDKRFRKNILATLPLSKNRGEDFVKQYILKEQSRDKSDNTVVASANTEIVCAKEMEKGQPSNKKKRKAANESGDEYE